MKKGFMVIFLTLIAGTVSALEHKGKISGFYINNNGTALVQFNRPVAGCPNSWPITFSVDSIAGKEWINMILTARSDNLVLGVGYGPSIDGKRCNNIDYFYLY